MRKVVRYLLLGAVAVAAFAAVPSQAQAQYPIAVTQVQPVVPAVVGYTAERRGLFGWRVVYRPVVAGVAAPVVTSAVPVTMAQPVVSQRVVVGYAPSAAPVTSFYAPAPAPVTSFYAPPVTVVAPVAAPITTYRIPTPVVYPAVGL